MAEILKKFSEYDAQTKAEDNDIILYEKGDGSTNKKQTSINLKNDIRRKYVASFSDGTWVSGGIDILATTHGLGATKNLSVKVYSGATEPYNEVLVSVYIYNNGNVRLESDTDFSGFYIIKGAIN